MEVPTCQCTCLAYSLSYHSLNCEDMYFLCVVRHLGEVIVDALIHKLVHHSFPLATILIKAVNGAVKEEEEEEDDDDDGQG